MKKAYITPKVTLYQITESILMTSSNGEWHLGDLDPPHDGGIIDEDEETL